MDYIKSFIETHPITHCYLCYKLRNKLGIECVGPFKSFPEADTYSAKVLGTTSLYEPRLIGVTSFFPSFLKKIELAWKLAPRVMLRKKRDQDDV